MCYTKWSLFYLTAIPCPSRGYTPVCVFGQMSGYAKMIRQAEGKDNRYLSAQTTTL